MVPDIELEGPLLFLFLGTGHGEGGRVINKVENPFLSRVYWMEMLYMLYEWSQPTALAKARLFNKSHFRVFMHSSFDPQPPGVRCKCAIPKDRSSQLQNMAFQLALIVLIAKSRSYGNKNSLFSSTKSLFLS